MRKHEIAVGAASRRVAARGMQTSRTFVVPASAADAAPRLTQDARLTPENKRQPGLRQSQALGIKRP